LKKDFVVKPDGILTQRLGGYRDVMLYMSGSFDVLHGTRLNCNELQGLPSFWREKANNGERAS
jgi:hypothetical protein